MSDLCPISASVVLQGGPHDGRRTPAMFPVEETPAEIDLPSCHTDEGYAYGRMARYRWRGSWHDASTGGVTLVFAFDCYPEAGDGVA